MPTRKAHARWEGTLTSDTMISLLRRRRSFDYEAVRRLDGAAYESLAPWTFSRDFVCLPSAHGDGNGAPAIQTLRRERSQVAAHHRQPVL